MNLSRPFHNHEYMRSIKKITSIRVRKIVAEMEWFLGVINPMVGCTPIRVNFKWLPIHRGMWYEQVRFIIGKTIVLTFVYPHSIHIFVYIYTTPRDLRHTSLYSGVHGRPTTAGRSLGK